MVRYRFTLQATIDLSENDTLRRDRRRYMLYYLRYDGKVIPFTIFSAIECS